MVHLISQRFPFVAQMGKTTTGVFFLTAKPTTLSFGKTKTAIKTRYKQENDIWLKSIDSFT